MYRGVYVCMYVRTYAAEMHEAYCSIVTAGMGVRGRGEGGGGVIRKCVLIASSSSSVCGDFDRL